MSSGAAVDRSNEQLTEKVKFRGVEYTIRELTIEEFDGINEKATVKTTTTVDGEDRETERIDGNTQSKLMIRACVTPSPPSPMGLRLFNGLRFAVNNLHFSDEPDELKAKKPAKKVDEEVAPGN